MGPSTELDALDRAIVKHLQQDVRTTNRALARSVGLSDSACLERVRRLEERGVVVGAHARVAPEALGIGLRALVSVRLRQHTRRSVAEFMEAVQACPEVVRVDHVTGSHDFVLAVVARDMHHLRDFTLDALTRQKNVARLETALVFASVERPGLPDLTAAPE